MGYPHRDGPGTQRNGQKPCSARAPRGERGNQLVPGNDQCSCFATWFRALRGTRDGFIANVFDVRCLAWAGCDVNVAGWSIHLDSGRIDIRLLGRPAGNAGPEQHDEC